MRRRDHRTSVITDAARSQEDQLRAREVRYVLLMLIRLVCLVVAAVVAATQPPLWWLWLILGAAGAVFLPWFAVVLANDPLPKERHRWRRHRTGPPRGVPAGEEQRPALSHPEPLESE